MTNNCRRMHGVASRRAPGGKANGMFKHGYPTAGAIAERRQLNAWIRTMRQAAEDIA